jgi:hypothetical protein
MLLVVISAIIGGIGTFSLMLSFGLLAALLSAPLGGSIVASIAGIYLASRAAKPTRDGSSREARSAEREFQGLESDAGAVG